ncbi:MAG: bifunctional salicylyl-CoA 5-hydroxylase/oxidoreductase [Gemmatimonadetes bacterium]|nr:bifunctional salicylyl-CoA 5-hydroxylase/oxidoreductase [Gemmatimonadota bacterium]
MRVICVGGGPAGLYLAIQLKRADPAHEVTVLERNRADDPFGFGVVFSDATGTNLRGADPVTFDEMAARFAHWDDIAIHYRGEVLRSTGHGFSGLSRRALLDILARRAQGLGVDVRYGCEVADVDALRRQADLVVASDGLNSTVRQRWAEHFRPTVDWRPNRFVWLGTTRPFPAFTFYFKADAHGLWRVHAYQYEGGRSTFIVEATEATWTRTGLAEGDEDATVAFCERLFAEELEGHRLLRNRSVWRRFPTVRCERWSWAPADGGAPVVLIGDAAHTAHFSIGSGTKLAMEDAIALAGALRSSDDVAAALAAYEAERKPTVLSTQRAAQVSLQWFEETERYMGMAPLQFAFNLLTRSLRVTHENLRVRDPAFVARVDAWFAAQAEKQSGVPVVPRADGGAGEPAADAAAGGAAGAARGAPGAGPAGAPAPRKVPPPLFAPFRVRELLLANRVVVSPMCQYSAEDGTPNDWHLVHLGSRAVGGAGLVMAEMTDISPEARISHGCTGLYRPEHVAAWRRITDFVHEHSHAAIGVQLGHAGRKASTRRMWEGDVEPLEEGAWPIVSASPIPYFPHSPVPREMTREEMERTLDDYVRATHMADAGGFDWLELHCAHGYLLASFISPLTNRRTDEFGGPLENRMRYPLEVFDAVRAVWPEHKPMSVRISAVDWVPGGVDSAEAVRIAALFKAHGCDVIDVSAGQTVPDQRPVYGRQFQTPFSDRIRHEAGIATMAVGNISSFTDVNTILAAGRADLVLMARAHLWDPYWTRHAAYELGYDLPWPPQYRSLTRYTPRFV